MYCRHCGNLMDPQAVVCVRCGCPKGQGVNHCRNCNAFTNQYSVICTQCGVSLENIDMANQKSKLVAGLLGIFLGSFGIHNFYLGYTGKAVAQLLITLLLCGGAISFIWSLIEAILIFTDYINVDGNGMPLKE